MNTLPGFINRRKSSTKNNQLFSSMMEAYKPLLASWLLELSLTLGWYKYDRHNWILEHEDFSNITGIEVEETVHEKDGARIVTINNKTFKYTDSAIRRLLNARLAYFSKQPVIDSCCLLKNINLFGEVIGLNQAERYILCFVASLHVFPNFKHAIASVSHKTSTHEMGTLIAYMYGQNEAEVLSGLRQDSTLIAAGIIELESHRSDLEDKLTLMRGLGSLLTIEHKNADELVGQFLKRAGETGLRLANFPHLAQDANTLTQFLARSISDREQGTNVLLYGIPGTGKTEFVKAIATVLGTDLYEISFSDDDGDPITGNDRLRAYNLCQRILCQKSNALLMFDEVEDVFPNNSGFLALFGLDESESGDKSGKAWINRTLERNTTPAIWVTNDANIDQAYLRRFDYSIRFPVPPQKVRMEIARHHLKQFSPSEDWLAKIAANKQMTPAQYERAAKVARVTSAGDHANARRLVEQALDRSATLLGQKQMPSRNAQYTGYDLQFANTSIAMPNIIAGLKKKRQGTFCFYGPAGTGKSELARHLADELEMPCVVRRASDILSMWVGGSEKNIAEMFAEARQQEALLVLDEADSFLADRRDAQRSWEVTQVNELLTQMEAFNGIFVCTTNLMEKLDQASLRRFAFKVKFDYLNPDQCWAMFTQELTRLGGETATAATWEKPVRDLAKLTPGDFAVAARQLSILDIPATAAELHRQLLEECKIKGGAMGKIGFVS